MSPNPTISVVTPSYNQARFIRETIESVSAQTYSPVEHIVIDGESTDGTVSILEEYDHLRWNSEPDQGMADALNKGFRMVRGDIVGWLNSDDVYFDTTVFERVVDCFDRYDADFVYSDIAYIDSTSDVMKIRCLPDFDYGRLLRGCFLEQPAVFFDAEVLQDHLLDDEYEPWIDYEYWLRCGRTYEFKHVKDIFAGDRNHPDRISVSERDALRDDAAALQREHGASTGIEHRIERASDIMLSGVPRRLGALNRTVSLRNNPPELAFDGSFYPLSSMLLNVFRSNVALAR